MCFGYAAKTDMSVFPSAQMMYPAAGVMQALLSAATASEKIRPASGSAGAGNCMGNLASALLINMVVYGGFLLSKVFREKTI